MTNEIKPQYGVTTKVFDASNPNFWGQLLIFILSMTAALGINFPADPNTMAGEITNTFSAGGLYAVIGVLALSVIMPIINFIRTKPKITVASFFGSANTWVYITTFVLSVLVLVGINIPAGTAEALVGAIFVKDWSAVIGIAATSILSPIIRFLINLRNKEKASLILGENSAPYSR